MMGAKSKLSGKLRYWLRLLVERILGAGEYTPDEELLTECAQLLHDGKYTEGEKLWEF